MSTSDEASLEGVEDALERLNFSIRSYNTGKREDSERSHGESPPSSRTQEYASSIEWKTGLPLFSRNESTETLDLYPSVANADLKQKLIALHELCSFISDYPYSIELCSRIASAYVEAGYPDLAAGSAYKALLLIDQLDDEDAEFYEPTFLSLAESISKESLLSRCEALEKHNDLQSSLFHPDCAQKNDEGCAIFPVSAEEVQVWATERYSQKV